MSNSRKMTHYKLEKFINQKATVFFYNCVVTLLFLKNNEFRKIE